MVEDILVFFKDPCLLFLSDDILLNLSDILFEYPFEKQLTNRRKIDSWFLISNKSISYICKNASTSFLAHVLFSTIL